MMMLSLRSQRGFGLEEDAARSSRLRLTVLKARRLTSRMGDCAGGGDEGGLDCGSSDSDEKGLPSGDGPDDVTREDAVRGIGLRLPADGCGTASAAPFL